MAVFLHIREASLNTLKVDPFFLHVREANLIAVGADGPFFLRGG